MAHNLTDIDTFSSTVTVPDGGDPRTAASVELPFQAVANRTINIRNRLDNFGVTQGLVVTHTNGIQARGGSVMTTAEFSYCDAFGAAATKSRIVMIPLANYSNQEWQAMNGTLLSLQASGRVELAVPVWTGCIITRVRLAYDSVSVPSTPPDFQLMCKTPVKTGTPSAGTIVEVSGVTGAATDAAQILDSGVFASPTVNLATQEWFIRVNGGNGASPNDVIYWAEVTFSSPGPRNH